MGGAWKSAPNWVRHTFSAFLPLSQPLLLPGSQSWIPRVGDKGTGGILGCIQVGREPGAFM